MEAVDQARHDELDRLIERRRGNLSEQETTEVMAQAADIRRRMAGIRGEGGS